MAVTPAQVDELRERYGDYLYHLTDKPSVFAAILASSALKPPSAEERSSNWPPRYRPRPGCVYLRVPVEAGITAWNPRALAAKAEFRTRWSELDPDAIGIDEDTVIHAAQAKSDLDFLPPFGGECLNLPQELRSPPDGVHTPEWILATVGMSCGEWVESLNVDSPENSYASARRGSVAFCGVIPGSAIEVNVKSKLGRLLEAPARGIDSRWLPLTDFRHE